MFSLRNIIRGDLKRDPGLAVVILFCVMTSLVPLIKHAFSPASLLLYPPIFVALSIFILRDEIKATFRDLTLLGGVVAMCLALLFVVMVIIHPTSLKMHRESLGWLLLFVFLVRRRDSEGLVAILLLAVVCLAAFALALPLFSEIGLMGFRLTGGYHPNLLSQTMLAGLAILYFQRLTTPRTKYVFIGIVLICLLGTYSRTAMAVLCMHLFFYIFPLWQRPLRIRLKPLSCCIGAAICAIPFSNEIFQLIRRDVDRRQVDLLNSRSEIWSIQIEKFLENPWVGSGDHGRLFRMWVRFGRAYGHEIDAHNLFLSTAVAQGVFAAILLLLFLMLFMLVSFWRARNFIPSRNVMVHPAAFFLLSIQVLMSSLTEGRTLNPFTIGGMVVWLGIATTFSKITTPSVRRLSSIASSSSPRGATIGQLKPGDITAV